MATPWSPSRETVNNHLNSVIDMYVWACRIFDEHHGYHDGPQSGNTGDSRVLFEIDAYLGAARRVYEAISKVLWKHYHPHAKGRWDSMRARPQRLLGRATRRCRRRSAI